MVGLTLMVLELLVALAAVLAIKQHLHRGLTETPQAHLHPKGIMVVLAVQMLRLMQLLEVVAGLALLAAMLLRLAVEMVVMELHHPFLVHL